MTRATDSLKKKWGEEGEGGKKGGPGGGTVT